MDLPRIHNIRRPYVAAGLAAIALPYLLAVMPAQQQPGDLPAAATLSAQLLGTAQARLDSCRGQNEACYLALQTAAAKLYLVQTVVAPEPVGTVVP